MDFSKVYVVMGFIHLCGYGFYPFMWLWVLSIYVVMGFIYLCYYGFYPFKWL